MLPSENALEAAIGLNIKPPMCVGGRGSEGDRLNGVTQKGMC